MEVDLDKIRGVFGAGWANTCCKLVAWRRKLTGNMEKNKAGRIFHPSNFNCLKIDNISGKFIFGWGQTCFRRKGGRRLSNDLRRQRRSNKGRHSVWRQSLIGYGGAPCQGNAKGKCYPKLFQSSYPLITAVGITLATFLAMLAFATVSTTASTSLYAIGASSANPASDPARIRIPDFSN
jgi:hypothetical protein